MFRHQNVAISKWSVGFFLTSFRKSKASSGSDDPTHHPLPACLDLEDPQLLHFILNTLLNTINQPRLFDRSGEFVLESLLEDFFLNWNEPKSEFTPSFWNSLIKSFTGIKWDVIPLFFVSAMMERLCPPAASCLTSENAASLQAFVSNKMDCLAPLLKSATKSHLLLLFTKSHKPSAKSGIQGYLEILDLFWGKRGQLIPGTEHWFKARTWLGNAPGFDSVNLIELTTDLQRKNVSTQAISLLWAMKFDGLEAMYSSEEMRFLISSIIEGKDRAYGQERIRDNLMLLNLLLKRENGAEKRQGRFFLIYNNGNAENQTNTSILDRFGNFLEDAAHNLIDSIFIILSIQVTRIDHLIFVEPIVQLLCKNLPSGRQLVKEKIEREFMSTMKTLAKKDNLDETDFVRFFVAMELVNAVEVRTDCRGILPVKIDCSSIRFENTVEDIQRKKLLAKYLARNIGSQWSILCRDASTVCNKNLLEEAGVAVQEGGITAAKSILICLREHLDKSEEAPSPDEMDSLLRTSYAFIFDFRKNDHFWPAVEAWIELCFSGTLVHCERHQFSQILAYHGSNMMKESAQNSGLAAILARTLLRVDAFKTRVIIFY